MYWGCDQCIHLRSARRSTGSARRASADIPSAGWRHSLNADYPPSTGADITLDGDLLAIMETLYKKVIARKALAWSFEDMVREIQHLIGQMTVRGAAELRGRKPLTQHGEVRER